MLSNLPAASRRLAPPRTVLVPGPRGETAGPPGRPDVQRERLRAALELLDQARAPGALFDLTAPGAD